MIKNEPDVRAELRARIQPLHTQLDQHPVLRGLAEAPDRGESDYSLALFFLQPFWTRFSEFYPGAAPHSRALLADIGLAQPLRRSQLPNSRALHYVMWGSTLGMRTMAKRIPPEWPNRFVRCCCERLIPAPNFQSFNEKDLDAAERIFQVLLQEADRYETVTV